LKEGGLYVVVLGRPTNSIWSDCQFRVSLRCGHLQFGHLASCRFGAPYWKNDKFATNMPDGTSRNLHCIWRGEYERVQGRIFLPNSGGKPPRWVWKHTVADELPTPFCRYFAALVARAAPGNGWRRLGEPRCLPWWRRRLGLDRAVAPTCRGRRLHAWAGALDQKLCGVRASFTLSAARTWSPTSLRRDGRARTARPSRACFRGLAPQHRRKRGTRGQSTLSRLRTTGPTTQRRLVWTRLWTSSWWPTSWRAGQPARKGASATVCGGTSCCGTRNWRWRTRR
jgi:hypothetical protein